MIKAEIIVANTFLTGRVEFVYRTLLNGDTTLNPQRERERKTERETDHQFRFNDRCSDKPGSHWRCS